MAKTKPKTTAKPKPPKTKRPPVPKPAQTPEPLVTQPAEAPKIPAHQWPNADGLVLILRCDNKDGISKNGFQHAMKVGETITEPQWNPTPACGGGIHGWPLGLGIGDGKNPDWQGVWRVYGAKPEDITGNVDGVLKCKFRTGVLLFIGTWYDATNYCLSDQIKWVHHNASGSASSTGESGSASSTGWSGSASSTGERGSASSTGERGSASSTGASGSASSTGESGSASSTGVSSAAMVTGIDGKVKAGQFGCIALAWWNVKEQRTEMRCALTGCDGGLKADVWYTLDTFGNFVEVK